MTRFRISPSLGRLVRPVALTLVVGAMGAGCTPAVGGYVTTTPDRGTTTLTVRNYHWADVHVDVALNGRAGIRLGTAPALGAVTFVLPRVIYLPNDLRFVAIPLGHQDSQMTESIHVYAGAKLDFTIENAAFVSTLTRRQ